MIKRLFKLILIILVATSCKTQLNTLYYFKNINSERDSLRYNPPGSYKIQTNDILYIRIFSINKEIVDLFNFDRFQFPSEVSNFITGFSVNDSGYIKVPILGKVYVLDMTVDEAQKVFQEKADKYISDATVTVKLVSFRVTVLGEVKHPGVIQNYKNDMNILEAISRSEELSEYGDRSHIYLIRTVKNTTKIVRLDLTDKNLMTSEYFYLAPNDIIYVQPYKAKIFKLNYNNISIFISSISMLLLAISYLRLI